MSPEYPVTKSKEGEYPNTPEGRTMEKYDLYHRQTSGVPRHPVKFLSEQHRSGHPLKLTIAFGPLEKKSLESN